tara:strand:+ start:1298 stop:1729 length:432 start_codon:yes stop_codon:yes gene_type:complete
MKYTKDVIDLVNAKKLLGYKEHVNPNTKVLQLKKSCELRLLKFSNTDSDNNIVWNKRDNGVEHTLVECSLKQARDFIVKAQLYKSSWEDNAVEIDKVYSAVCSINVTEEGSNSLSPNSDDSYFTLFSNVGVATSNAGLAVHGF